MKQETVFLFGASLGGKRAFKSLRKEYDIIGFVDNDGTKHGSILMGKPVRSPADLATMTFDKVFIASSYAAEIMYQLRQDLGLPPEKIALVPSEVLNGDDEVPWGCLSVILVILGLAGWGLYSLFT